MTPPALDIGEMIARMYPELLAVYGCPDLASLATAVLVNEALTLDPEPEAEPVMSDPDDEGAP